jgi:hypothetical protein
MDPGIRDQGTYSLVKVICAELHSRVWHNSYAIGAIASHEPSPTLVSPHLRQRFRNRHLVFISAGALDLEQNLQSFQRRDDGSGNGSGHATGYERGKDRLRNEFFEAFNARCGGLEVSKSVVYGRAKS